MNNIQWKQIYIDGNETNYYISDNGQVKKKKKKGYKIIKGYNNQNGYKRVDIFYNTQDNKRKRKSILIHRLVAEAFIINDNPKEKDTIHHIDYDKTNNKKSNLIYISRADNIRLAHKRRKEKNESIKQSKGYNDIERSM